MASLTSSPPQIIKTKWEFVCHPKSVGCCFVSCSRELLALGFSLLKAKGHRCRIQAYGYQGGNRGMA